MTVGYMRAASTANPLTFIRLLFRWQGSVWKSVWWELLFWIQLYGWISVIYRFFLINNHWGRHFEHIVRYCQKTSSDLTQILTFTIGFYVSYIAGRWWSVFMSIPWPDSTALSICAFLRDRGPEHREEDRRLRGAIVRYMLVSFVLVFRSVSEKIIKRFPTYEHFESAQLLASDELKLILDASTHRRFWLPIEWSLALLKKTYARKQIDEMHYAVITNHLLKYRESLHQIISYDWVSVPLVYVQVVNLCTILYFLIQAVARQPIANQSNEWMNTTIPWYPMMEFVVFFGWLKVAQVMLNPFGLDDDDFEVDALIERNLNVSYGYVIDLFDHPPSLKDLVVKKLPHTMASAALISNASQNYVGSAARIEVKPEQAVIVPNKKMQVYEAIFGGKKAESKPLIAEEKRPEPPPVAAPAPSPTPAEEKKDNAVATGADVKDTGASKEGGGQAEKAAEKDIDVTPPDSSPSHPSKKAENDSKQQGVTPREHSHTANVAGLQLTQKSAISALTPGSSRSKPPVEKTSERHAAKTQPVTKGEVASRTSSRASKKDNHSERKELLSITARDKTNSDNGEERKKDK